MNNRKSKIKKHITTYIGIAVLVMLMAAGCGRQEESQNTKGTVYYHPSAQEESTDSEEEESEEAQNPLEELYLILSVDNETECMRVYRYATGMEYQYYYALSTQFLDKYGNHTSVSNFTTGKIVYLGDLDRNGKLLQVQTADTVWEYERVRQFSVDEERGIFTIAGIRYIVNDNTFLLSDGKQLDFSQLTSQDELTVIGLDKNLLSIIVTTGHGILQLSNTDLFEGSYLQLNTNIFTEITADMQLELPEGDYILSVAKDGWGGTCEITIERGKETIVDLDTIKGEGPQYGSILFSVDLEGAVIKIDGNTIDYSEPVSLSYGWHTMEVEADGYSEWNKKLYVNSQEATILIELDEESEEEEDTVSSNDTTSEEQNSQNSSESTDNSTEEDLLKDYLSTLTELIGTF